MPAEQENKPRFPVSRFPNPKVIIPPDISEKLKKSRDVQHHIAENPTPEPEVQPNLRSDPYGDLLGPGWGRRRY